MSSNRYKRIILGAGKIDYYDKIIQPRNILMQYFLNWFIVKNLLSMTMLIFK
jgi:hypothetical protein